MTIFKTFRHNREEDLERLGQEWTGVSTSEGTLTNQELIEKHLDIIQFDFHDSLIHPDTQDWLECLDKYKGNPYNPENQEALSWLWEEISTYLREVAPKNCYFGSHPGDGALFGFWKEA